jgi:hypothetical protein
VLFQAKEEAAEKYLRGQLGDSRGLRQDLQQDLHQDLQWIESFEKSVAVLLGIRQQK